MENDQDDEYINNNSKLGKLIVKVNQIEKKPILDNSLSEILDRFLEYLRRSDDFLSNGIFQINFAEAALLLQSSAFVYSKKVDLLWDSINQCQKRMISFNTEQNKEELNRLEEREQKYKRKRKVVEKTQHKEKSDDNIKNFQIDWNDLHNDTHLQCQKDSRLFSKWYKRVVVNRDLQPSFGGSRSLSEKKCHFRGDKSIYDIDQDDEFVAYTSKMESVMGLEELILQQNSIHDTFSFELFTELYLKPKFFAEYQMRYDDLEKHSEKFEKYVSACKDQYFSENTGKNIVKSSLCELRQNPQKLRRISVSSTIVSRLPQLDLDMIYGQKCQVNLLRLSVDDLSRLSRLSVDEIRQCCEAKHDVEGSKVENFQANDSTDKKVVIGVDDALDVAKIGDDAAVEPLENNPTSNNIVENIPTSDTVDPTSDNIVENTLTSNNIVENNPSSDNIVENNPSSDKIEEMSQNLQECSGGDLGTTETAKEGSSNSTEKAGEISKIPVDTNSSELLNKSREVVRKVKYIELNTNVDENDEDDDHIPIKRRKLSKAAMKKLATGITADLKDFNVFFAAHYLPEEGEGQVEIPEFEIDDPIETSSWIDPQEETPLSKLSETVICSQDSGYESRVDNNESRVDNHESRVDNHESRVNNHESRVDPLDDSGIEHENLLSPIPTNAICATDQILSEAGTSLEHCESQNKEAESQPIECVSSTGETEKPLYQKVYEWKQYMSEKFKRMTSTDFDIHEYGSRIMGNLDSERPKPFGEMVAGKSSAEVTRFFISALQLANTYNVEIQGAQSGKLSNETFTLKLMNKERHYDKLKDYVAPSEENYHQRLENAKNKRGCPSSSNVSSRKRGRYE